MTDPPQWGEQHSDRPGPPGQPGGAHGPGEQGHQPPGPDRGPWQPQPSAQQPRGPFQGQPQQYQQHQQYPHQQYPHQQYPHQQYGQPSPQRYGQPYGPPGYPPQPYAQQGYYGPPYGTAPYPQAGYGAPPKKRRTGLIIGLVAVGVVVAGLAVVLSSSLGTRVLNRSAVQRDVAAQFEQREGVRIDLTCGSGMKLAKDATYQCRGTTAEGEAVTLDITVTDPDRARYTWSERH